MPRTNTSGVSNAGPIEEPTVLRADGSRVEVHVPVPKDVSPDPEPEAKPAKTTGRGRSGGK